MKKQLDEILFIEDNKITNVLMRWDMEEGQWANKIKTVTTAEEALGLLNTHKNGSIYRPDIIFLDLGLESGKIDGFDFLEACQDLPKMDSTKVVILTNSELEEHREKATKYAIVDEYFRKPFTQEDMTDLISNHFEKESA